jgi:hypothetical protein
LGINNNANETVSIITLKEIFRFMSLPPFCHFQVKNVTFKRVDVNANWKTCR